MKKQTIFLYLILSLLMYNCTQSNKENKVLDGELTETSKEELAEGFQLLENNCFSCHSPNASLENRIAPPMEAIKKHYVNKQTSQAEFTQDLIEFMNNPTEEKSKMPGAVDRFNLMPKMNFSEDQLTKIAAYIFLSELEKPDWFEKHYQEERLKNNLIYNKDTTPIKIGQNIALQTKSILGKNLLGAINANGTENAISFCSTKAIPLTDSMAVALNANIKRVSDKNRNPNNKANEAELVYIEALKMAISQGETPKPNLTTTEDKHIAYYPIMTDKMCMQCHGQRETEILPSTLNKIGEIYPNDLATGYKIGELRGIWVVEMDKKK